LVAASWLLHEVAKRAHRLEEDKKPKLGVVFGEPRNGFVSHTHYTREPHSIAPIVQAIYVHVLPETLSNQIIKNCRGYLMAVHRKVNDRWAPTAYRNRLELTWSHVGSGPQDIIPGVKQFLDVLKVDSKERIIVPCTQLQPNSTERVFQFRGTGPYKFDIMVVGDDNSRATISLEVTETKDWKKPKVKVVTNGAR
jgi:hypothetical protein